MTDQPEWITGATYWQDLTTKYRVTQPSASTDDQNATYALFAQGKIAMFRGGPWARPEIQRNKPNMTFGKDFSVSIVPYPAGKHPGTCQGGWLQSIWTASKVQGAARTLMVHYHTPENIALEAARWPEHAGHRTNSGDESRAAAAAGGSARVSPRALLCCAYD